MQSKMDVILFGPHLLTHIDLLNIYIYIYTYVITTKFVKDIPSAQVLSYSMWQSLSHRQQQRLPFMT